MARAELEKYTGQDLASSDARTCTGRRHGGVAPFPEWRDWLGYAGCWPFFNADFRGAGPEVSLLPNSLFPGRRSGRRLLGEGTASTSH